MLTAAQKLNNKSTSSTDAKGNESKYIYSNPTWQDQLTQIKTYTVNQTTGIQTLTDTQSISYDAMGNPTSYLGKTMEWEGKQLSSLNFGNNTISYAYDENGLRTRKTVNGTTTNYHYNGSVLIGMTQGTGANQTKLFFSYDSSGNIVSVSWDAPTWYLTSGTLYYTRNAQGDIIGLVDDNGTRVVEFEYDSWGKDWSYQSDYQQYFEIYELQPFRYRGYVYDAETGWYYLQSRYYDPATARFISADVLLSTGQGVLGHNSYAYCLNNPVNMSDEGGSIPKRFFP